MLVRRGWGWVSSLFCELIKELFKYIQPAWYHLQSRKEGILVCTDGFENKGVCFDWIGYQHPLKWYFLQKLTWIVIRAIVVQAYDPSVLRNWSSLPSLATEFQASLGDMGIPQGDSSGSPGLIWITLKSRCWVTVPRGKTTFYQASQSHFLGIFDKPKPILNNASTSYPMASLSWPLFCFENHMLRFMHLFTN